MIGWQATLGAGRRATEALAWAAALAAVLSLIAATTALAMIFDLDVGREAEEKAVMIDLPPLEPAVALQDVPEPAPEVPMPELQKVEAPQETAETIEPPAEVEPDPAPQMVTPEAIEMPEQTAETMPDTTPPPPPPEIQPEVALEETPRPPERPEPPERTEPRKEKREHKPREERRQAEERRDPQRQEASRAANGGQTVSAGRSSPREIDRWKGKVQSMMQRHMTRQRFESGQLVLSVQLDPAGQVLAASVTRSSGRAELDAEVLQHLRRLHSLPAPPAGAPTRLAVPIRVD